MEIRRTFSVPEWDESVQQRAIEYWRERGVELRIEQDGRLVGRRGSLWGNMFAAAISKAPATVYMRCTSPTVECVTDVVTRFRGVTPITPANRSYLHLELAIFESFLLRGDLQPEAWIEHKRIASKATRELMHMTFKYNLYRTATKVVASSRKTRGWLMLFVTI